ncbi:hypothetical protein ACWGH2_02460 [Streptomyces sp. NPDC054871]
MTTDAWNGTRTRVARLLGCGDPAQQAAIEGRLDDNRAVLARNEEADADEAREGFVILWRVELAQFLRRHPDAEHELQDMVHAVRGELPESVRLWSQKNEARDNGQVYGVMGGNLNVYHSPPEAPSGTPHAPGAGDSP